MPAFHQGDQLVSLVMIFLATTTVIDPSVDFGRFARSAATAIVVNNAATTAAIVVRSVRFFVLTSLQLAEIPRRDLTDSSEFPKAWWLDLTGLGGNELVRTFLTLGRRHF